MDKRTYKRVCRKVTECLLEEELRADLDVCIAGDIFIYISEAFIDANKKTADKRKVVRDCFLMMKNTLEEKFGQSLFDEEFDNKIYKE